MAVNSVQPVNVQTAPQQKQTGGAAKAVASYFVPGLGEFLDGRNKSGAFFFAARTGVALASAGIGAGMMRDMTNSMLQEDVFIPTVKKNKTLALGALGIAGMGLAIANIVNAYKGEKTPKAEKTK